MKNTLVFVYGTLKSGKCNNSIITINLKANKIADVKTIEKYPLYMRNGVYYPFLQNTPGIGENITGEVWEVPNMYIPMLDLFEGTPTLYNRKEIQVKDDKDNIYTAQVYFVTKELDAGKLKNTLLLSKF